jgi:hypothetical protein
LVLVILVLAGAAMVAGTSATREATVQGWFTDGLWRLVLDAFWRRFDPIAGAALALSSPLLGPVAARPVAASGADHPTSDPVVALAAPVRLGACGRLAGPGLPISC